RHTRSKRDWSSDVCSSDLFLATRGRGSRTEKPLSTHHIHGSPVVYDSPNQGVLVYVWGENEVLRTFQYDPISHGFSGQPNARNEIGRASCRERVRIMGGAE